jgi:cobyrinic acid a,c-diamide synthase
MEAPAGDKNLLLNKAEITFHELHKAKLTTFDFFKQLTEMHEMKHDDNCGTAAANLTTFSKYHHFMCGDDDDPWV